MEIKNFKFKKKYGQNFLIDSNITNKIANVIKDKTNSLVIEIGCGDGRLTKQLCNYYDIEILTHINSDNEGVSKIKYFDKMLPGVKVNVVPKAIAKADFIDPKGIILVDDFIPNLDYWSHKGGISVKFSDSGKECDYVTITDLMDLTKVNFKMRYKVKE